MIGYRGTCKVLNEGERSVSIVGVSLIRTQPLHSLPRMSIHAPYVHSQPLVQKMPKLKLVMEHITTSEAVAFVTAAPANVAATITPQHLLYNRNAIFQVRGGLFPRAPRVSLSGRTIHTRCAVLSRDLTPLLFPPAISCRVGLSFLTPIITYENGSEIGNTEALPPRCLKARI